MKHPALVILASLSVLGLTACNQQYTVVQRTPLSEAGVKAVEQDYTIIKPDTTLYDISRYCDVSSFITTFATHPTLGVGWGASATHSSSNLDGFNPVPHQMQCCTLDRFQSITHVRVRMKSYAEEIYGKTGYLYISRPLPDADKDWNTYSKALYAPGGAGGLATNIDAWGGNFFNSKQQTSIKNIVANQDLVLRTDAEDKDVVIDVDYQASELQICMGGDTNPPYLSGYNKRYIYELTIRATPRQ